MKILFVVEHFYPYVGGAEELFLNLSVALADKGHDVSVVTTSHDNDLPGRETYRGVKITRVRCPNRLFFTVMGFPEVFHAARNADLIHTTSYNSAVPAIVAGMLRAKKVIITFHEVWGRLWFRLPFMPKWKLRLFYYYERLILSMPFYRYIAVSDFTSRALINGGVNAEKVIRIYNGLNYELLSEYHHQPPATFSFCFFGRLGISKGLDVLLPGARIFFDKHPEARLKLIIPTYPKTLFRKIKTLIGSYRLESNLVLMHNLDREKLLREVSISSCVIVPSYSEGFGFAAAEAVAMKIPLITSGKGALAEVAGGRTIEIKELTPEAVAESMVKALKGEWEERTVARFNLEENIESHIRLYNSLQQ